MTGARQDDDMDGESGEEVEDEEEEAQAAQVTLRDGRVLHRFCHAKAKCIVQDKHHPELVQVRAM